MLTNSVWWRSSLFSTISWLYVWQVQTEYFRRPLRASDVCGVILAEALMSGLRAGCLNLWSWSPCSLWNKPQVLWALHGASPWQGWSRLFLLLSVVLLPSKLLISLLSTLQPSEQGWNFPPPTTNTHMILVMIPDLLHQKEVNKTCRYRSGESS